MTPFPAKKYQIIYADPPWSYRDKALAGDRGAACKYDTQETYILEELPVKDIADKDCALFLWVTMPKLDECMSLISAWGFNYKTCAFTWVKRNKESRDWFIGMGRWTRANAELCLIATKGSPKRINAGIRSVVDVPVEEHSKKPYVVKKLIVELMGNLPRIELFSRQHTDGWDSWGDEAGTIPWTPDLF